MNAHHEEQQQASSRAQEADYDHGAGFDTIDSAVSKIVMICQSVYPTTTIYDVLILLPPPPPPPPSAA